MKTACLCATLIATTWWQSRAIGQCAAYEATVLEGLFCPLWGNSAAATAISANGSVCGGTADCGQGYVLHWTGGASYETYPFPSGTKSVTPHGLNDMGAIVGYWNPTGSAERAFKLVDGDFMDLQPLAGDGGATAYSIANDGRIVGYSNQSTLRAVIWHDRTVTPIVLPMGPSSVAFDISDTGFVCGYMGVHPLPVYGAHAFIWRDGKVTDLGAFPESATEARAVNNDGQACGIHAYQPGKLEVIRRGFFWSEGVMQDIGTLPGFVQAFALDINDRAEIVGYCLNELGYNRAFIWRDGVMTALNDFLAPELELDFDHAAAINNAGQITGTARKPDGNGVAIILSPIPETPGDFNCDRTVNVDDLLAVIQYWNNDINNPADFDRSGQVGVGDLLIVLDNWSL